MGENKMMGTELGRKLCAGRSRALGSAMCKSAGISLGSGTVKCFLVRGPTY